MESSVRSINFKNLLLIFISLTFISNFNSRADAEILKNDHVDELDFETALNQNSVKFHEYENPENLFDDFFGLGDPLNESPFNTNFQDLTLQIDSKNAREVYKKKLLEMTKISKKNKEDKPSWSFFNKKI